MLITSRNILLDVEILRETFVYKSQTNVNTSYYAKLIINISLISNNLFYVF